MIKAVFFDIDNTLLSHRQKMVPKTAVKSIEILRKKGIMTFIATGRSFMELNRLPVDKTLFDGFIISNGQICVDKSGDTIRDKPISKEDIESMVPVFNERKTPIVFVQRDRMYINCENDHVKAVQKEISSPIPPFGEYQGDKVYQMTVYTKDDPEKITRHLKSCHLSRWHSGAFDLIPKAGGKDYGIRSVIDKYNINLDETMAFGDSENDLSMLKCAGISVAMGNSMEKTKSYADYVTDHIDEDGILKALLHYNLIDKSEL